MAIRLTCLAPISHTAKFTRMNVRFIKGSLLTMDAADQKTMDQKIVYQAVASFTQRLQVHVNRV